MRYHVFVNQTEVVSLMYCYSVRTNGEGWFRMHPPMHALYHLPNLGSHPTPQPDLKPTPCQPISCHIMLFAICHMRADIHD